MKILVSAFACTPGAGSEAGLGWRWALEIAARGHEVWVLTRSIYKSDIEAVSDSLIEQYRLNFIYYDVPRWISWWHKGLRGIRMYYVLWQWAAARVACRQHRQHKFDLVHHVTYVSARFPSFMGKLGIPFVFGPVAGGDTAPMALRRGYSWKGWIKDLVRDISNSMIRFDPNMRRTFSDATLIVVNSPASRDLIPTRYSKKVHIDIGIGVDPMGNPSRSINAIAKHNGNTRILFVGNLLYLKGMHLGLPAFAKVVGRFPEARLTIVGSGPDENLWRRIECNLGINGNVDWIPRVERRQMDRIYSGHDIFLFPSLHDSGGWVVMEALIHALPVVCLDIGGPARMVDENCGRIVVTDGRPRQAVVDGIADALLELVENATLRRRLAKGALENARQNDWSKVVGRVYEIIEGL